MFFEDNCLQPYILLFNIGNRYTDNDDDDVLCILTHANSLIITTLILNKNLNAETIQQFTTF